jgi:hypothetical protein
MCHLSLAAGIGGKTVVFTRQPRSPTRLTYLAQGLGES